MREHHLALIALLSFGAFGVVAFLTPPRSTIAPSSAFAQTTGPIVAVGESNVDDQIIVLLDDGSFVRFDRSGGFGPVSDSEEFPACPVPVTDVKFISETILVTSSGFVWKIDRESGTNDLAGLNAGQPPSSPVSDRSSSLGGLKDRFKN